MFVRCWICKRSITGVRTIIEEKWTCQECTYYHDMGLDNPNKPEKGDK